MIKFNQLNGSEIPEEFLLHGINPIRNWDLFWFNLEEKLYSEENFLYSQTYFVETKNFPVGTKNFPVGTKNFPVGTKRQRCGKCTECNKSNCGKCINCLDKNGQNKRKQRCRTIGLCLLWNFN